ncbi:MAG TPA: hypothetical protein VG248_16520 [Caulobacteraceae bacterium]|jgi:hypothetical protein|nr:hypothetical protein [Caulobacteraceae bacterium]
MELAPARFILTASPALGGWSVAPLARALAARDKEALIVDLHPRRADGARAYGWLGWRIAQVATEGDVLVMHSGAGAVAAAAIEAASGRFSALVFLDALLPHPGQSWLQTCPSGLASRLRMGASDEMLPPWIDWWGSSAAARLWPNPELRDQLRQTLPRLPVNFAEGVAPPSPPLPAELCAYIQLSSDYAAERAAAQALGWRTSSLDLDHLAVLTAPDAVAAAILEAADLEG